MGRQRVCDGRGEARAEKGCSGIDGAGEGGKGDFIHGGEAVGGHATGVA